MLKRARRWYVAEDRSGHTLFDADGPIIGTNRELVTQRARRNYERSTFLIVPFVRHAGYE